MGKRDLSSDLVSPDTELLLKVSADATRFLMLPVVSSGLEIGRLLLSAGKLGEGVETGTFEGLGFLIALGKGLEIVVGVVPPEVTDPRGL